MGQAEQTVAVVEPVVVEKVPAGHAEQLVVPVRLEYVPAGQLAQAVGLDLADKE